MITNERQYRIAKAELRKFEQALAATHEREPSPDVTPQIHAAMADALTSEAEELRRQLRDYDQLKEGRVKGRTLGSLRDLPIALIEARIAANITQKALAKLLGVAEQQVQRWEATTYAGVGIERIQDVADALGVEMSEKLSFRPAAHSSARRKPSAKTTGKAPSGRAAKARA